MIKITKRFYYYILQISLFLAYFLCPHEALADQVTRDPFSAASNGGGTVAWNNPTYVFYSDNSYSNVSLGKGIISQYLQITNFGFTIPSSSIINGIKVEIERHANNALIRDNSLKIIKGGVVSGNEKANTATGWPTSDPNSYVAYGVGTTDKWGLTWTADDINSGNFGVAIDIKNNKTGSGATYIGYIDHVRITVYYTPVLTLSQSNYRWYVNNPNSSDVTDPWPAGTTNLNENTAIGSSDSPLSRNDIVRLRISILGTGLSLPANNRSFKLKYAIKGDVCGVNWLDVGSTGSTSSDWRGYDNTNVANGGTLSSTKLTGSNINESYNENGLTNNNPNSLGIDQKGEWDWVLQNYTAQPGTSYCFKIVNSDGSDLNGGYLNYPILTTYLPPPVSIINQRSGILENDSIGVSLPSQHIAKIGEKIKVRIQIDTGDGIPINKNFKLQYDKNDNNWAEVKLSNEIRPASSLLFENGSLIGGPKSGACASSTSWAKGSLFSGTAITSKILLTGYLCSEYSFIIDTTKATPDTTYRFRLVNAVNNSPFSNYYSYPTLTTVNATSNTKKYSKELQTTLSAGVSDLKHVLDNSGYSNLNTEDLATEMLNNILSDTQVDVTFVYPGSDTTPEFGSSVSSAGDVNGDGYEDVVVGAPLSDSTCLNCGAAYIFYGGPTLSGQYSIQLNNPESSDARFGSSVSSAGDVNGDGYSDVLIAAEGSGVKCAGCGAVYLYLGGPSITGSGIYFEYKNTDIGASFGSSIASVGDLNKDGYSDIAIGAPFSDEKCTNCGAAYVYYGGLSINSVSDISLVYVGTDALSKFGASLNSAGDVNRDGYLDVIVSARTSDISCTDCGGAYIYLGGSSFDGTSDISLVYPDNDASGFGRAVASAGDVNGDGYGDVVVGASDSSTVCSYCGAAFIFYGGASMNGVSDLTLIPPSTGFSYFGLKVASVGDYNLDGYSDVVVGASNELFINVKGSAYIFYGGASMNANYDVLLKAPPSSGIGYFSEDIAIADLNSDGFPDFLSGADYAQPGGGGTYGAVYVFYSGVKTDSTQDKMLSYPNSDTGAGFGWAIASAGDVNGDNYDDVIVGAYTSSTKCSGCGAAYIFYGGPRMNTNYDIYLQYPGTDTGATFGARVASAGDVNGDGYGDVIVGAYNSSTKCSGCGAAYIFFGGKSPDGISDVYLVYPESDASASFGDSVASAGDINHDGFDDVVVGADYSDKKVADGGSTYIFYGGSLIPETKNYDVYIPYPGTENANFGVAVSGNKDINGDGYEDIVIGAISSGAKCTGCGAAYVYYGGPTFDTVYDVRLDYPGNDMSLFGGTVSIDDINGDGYGDTVIGASYSNLKCSFCGAAFVYFGGSNLPNVKTYDVYLQYPNSDAANFGNWVSTGDTNKDGYADVIVGAQRSTTKCAGCGAIYVFYGGLNMSGNNDMYIAYPGSDTDSMFGSSSALVDLNNDNYQDLVSGAFYSNIKCTDCGVSYIYFGGKSAAYPEFSFNNKSLSSCSSLNSISARWLGASTIGGSGNPITLQVWRFGGTNSWTTISSNNTFTANTPVQIGTTITTNLSEYCDSNNWSYWRLYQNSGNMSLSADSWQLNFESAVHTPTSPLTPYVNNNSAQTGQASPASGLTDHTPAFSAIFDDPNTSDTASYYQLQVNSQSDFLGTSLWDSGKTTISSCNENSRCSDIVYNGSTLSDGTTYYWRIKYWDNSNSEGEWSVIQQFSLNSPPAVSDVTLNNNSNISLIENSSIGISWVATITDADGNSNISSARGKIFRSGVTGSQDCSLNDKNCYQDSSCDLSGCSGNTCTATCLVNVLFFADPTDIGSSYAAQSWKAWVEATDTHNETGSTLSSSSAQDVFSLNAFDITSSINYGFMLPGEDTNDVNKETVITNTGNRPLDIEISGDNLCTDYPSCSGYLIPATNQQYSSAGFTYGAGTTLSTSPATVNLNVAVASVSPSNSHKSIYWGISIPNNESLGDFAGSITVLEVPK